MSASAAGVARVEIVSLTLSVLDSDPELRVVEIQTELSPSLAEKSESPTSCGACNSAERGGIGANPLGRDVKQRIRERR
jgi:hypothetical protein